MTSLSQDKIKLSMNSSSTSSLWEESIIQSASTPPPPPHVASQHTYYSRTSDLSGKTITKVPLHHHHHHHHFQHPQSINCDNEDSSQQCSLSIQVTGDTTSSLVDSLNNNNNNITNNNNNAFPISKRLKCLSKELLTCAALTTIVIGLPIMIIIVLINLPRMSNRRDTRQQHYILLAFGFPFSLVIIVSTMYGLYRLILRIRKGPDNFNYFRTRMSLRRISTRFRRGFNRRHCFVENDGTNGHSHCHHSDHQNYSQQSHSHHSHSHCACPSSSSYLKEQCEMCYVSKVPSYIGENFNESCNSSSSTPEPEPKLYSLVTQVMSSHKGYNNNNQLPTQFVASH